LNFSVPGPAVFPRISLDWQNEAEKDQKEENFS